MIRKCSLFVIWSILSGTVPVFLSLVHADGPRHGLKAEYFSDPNFEKKEFERIDPNVECFWDWGSPSREIRVDDFSIRWTGWLRAPKPGRYRFYVYCDDGITVRLNGEKVIDQKREGIYLEHVSLELGDKPIPISVDYFELSYVAFCVLLWEPVGAPSACPIPPEAFFPDEKSIDGNASWKPDDRQGLTIEYFDHDWTKKLKVDRAVRTEALWHEGAPAWGIPADCACRYTGFLVPEVTGDYKFVCSANDHLRMWLDGKPLREARYGQPKASTAVIKLEAHHTYPLRLEFVDDGSIASFSLQWVRPYEDSVTSIPTSCLFQSRQAVPRKDGD